MEKWENWITPKGSSHSVYQFPNLCAWIRPVGRLTKDCHSRTDPWEWHRFTCIDLDEWLTFTLNVGKYTIPMDPMGMIGMYFLNKFSRGIKLNMEGLEKGDNSELGNHWDVHGTHPYEINPKFMSGLNCLHYTVIRYDEG